MKVKIIANNQIMDFLKLPKSTIQFEVLDGLLMGKTFNFQDIKNIHLINNQCLGNSSGFSKGFSIGFNS